MSTPINVSDQPAGSVSASGRYRLDLTGPRSHVLVTEPGRGNLIIGPISMGRKADLHVSSNEAINWSALDPFATPAGSPWPRNIDYRGNDSRFFTWSEQRPIEDFRWTPAFADARTVDASAAKIGTLQIRLGRAGGTLDVILPQVARLALVGDLSKFTVTGQVPRTLFLEPELSRRRSDAPYRLPELGMVEAVSSLSIIGSPMGQPITLVGIERFPQLDSLAIRGRVNDWAELEKLPRLKRLEIRFAPDLTGLPALDAWPELDMLIAYNVDETAGKLLKARMKAREKFRPWDRYASVSKLRKPEWWATEFGRPFAGWNGRLAKAANAAFDVASTAIEKAEDLAAAESAVTAFVAHFNTLKGIETTEREDIAEAVWQFSQLDAAARLGVTEEKAQSWFDKVREY